MAGEKATTLPRRQETNQPTSGTRGIPNMDFDFLNAVESLSQSELGDLGNEAKSAHMDLSTMLNKYNTQLTETRNRKRNNDVVYRDQANKLAAQSDQITQQAFEAAADPLNELKALFTDTPSQAELAARQNNIQNQMNAVRRNYTSDAASYNYELQQVQQGLQFAQARVGLSNARVDQVAKLSQALAAKINARGILFDQQLNTMLLPELEAELADVNSQIPQQLVESRILALKKAKADLATARAKTGDTITERQAKEFKLLKEHFNFLDRQSIDAAYLNDTTVVEPFTGIKINKKMATVLRDMIDTENEERGATRLALLESNLAGEHAIQTSFALMQRAAPPGVNIIGFDPDKGALAIDLTVLPPEMQELSMRLRGIQEFTRDLDHTLSNPNLPDSQMRRDAMVSRTAMMNRATEIGKELRAMAVKHATTGMKDEEAIAAKTQYIETGYIANENGAGQLMVESVAGLQPGMNVSGEHGAGFGEGLALYSQFLGEEWDSLVVQSPDLIPDGEDGKQDLVAAVLAGMAGKVKSKEAYAIAHERALRQVDASQTNAVAAATLNSMYEVSAVYGIKALMEMHENEPETQAALATLISGDIALSPMVTGATTADGKELEDVSTLFGSLAILEAGLKEKGKIPPDASLVNEYKNLLMTNQFYLRPEMKALVTAKTDAGAALNRALFRNTLANQVRDGLSQAIRGIPTDTLPIIMEYFQLESQRLVDDPASGKTFEEQAFERSQKSNELREQFGDERSLAPVIKSLLESTGQ